MSKQPDALTLTFGRNLTTEEIQQMASTLRDTERWSHIKENLAKELDEDNQTGQPYVSAMDVQWLMEEVTRLEEEVAQNALCGHCRYSDADFDKMADKILRACDHPHAELPKEIRTIVIHARSA